MGLFRPTGTSRVVVFRVLRYIRSVAISCTFCFPRCLPSLFGFLPWSAWVPLFMVFRPPPGRFRSFRSATSLRPGPWLIVSSELVPVVRFGSASELCSRLFRALPTARFHPCCVSALSPGLLSPFEVSGFWCPARPCGLPFPPSQFLLPWGFSAPLKLLSLGVTRVALPLWGFFLLPFFRFKLDFGQGLLVHLKAYELSPVQLLPPLRPTHGSTYRYASKFKVFRICDSFFKDLSSPCEES